MLCEQNLSVERLAARFGEPSANPETRNVEISLARFFIFAAPNGSRDAAIATYRDT
jgi:hypothetical protein